MKKFKARWLALFTAVLLLCSFVLAACGTGVEQEGLGELRDIFIVTNGLKTTYDVGDTFDYSVVKIRAVYEGGEENLNAADADKGVTHTDLDMANAGTQKLTVTYKTKEASVDITVRAKEKAVLKGLQFSGGKTAYTVNDAIDYHSFELTAIYSIGEDVKLYGDSQGVTHNTVSTAEAGTQKLTFTYTEGGATKSVSVDIIISAAPAPVTLISIEVQSNAADRTVEYGGTVDYSKFTIVCHYSDGSTNTEPLNGTSAGVTHNEIVTTNAGEQDLTFNYEGKSATVPVTVLAQVKKQTLARFAAPKFYADAAAIQDDAEGTASTDRDSFMKGFETYKVGDDNAFEFQPDATALTSTTQEVAVTVRTTFTLEEKGADGSFTPVAEEDVASYVTTEPLLPNYYYFTEAAVGKVFKLTVKPDEASYTFQSTITDESAKKIEAVIEIVDGYNVYNQIGLSVFDNLNVKHWAALKEEAGTLRWDSKPLAEYNIIKKGDEKYAPVANVVLHSDIIIDPDELPESYFWKVGETIGESGYTTVDGILQNNPEIPDSVKNYLEGSLKDGLNQDQYYKFDDSTSGDLEEEAKTSVNMQKGVYVSTGTGIQGNFHGITYHTSGAKHSLYTVYDGKSATGSASPLSHWSLFKYGNETTEGVEIVNGGEPNVSDLRILGQSPRLASTDGEPSHPMAFNSCTNTMSLENCIISRLFVAVLGDEASSGVNVSDAKIFDIYSNMFYLWRAKIEVKNSIMEDAGGPVFILCDGDRIKKDYSTDDSNGPQLVTDTASRFKSEAAGSESWYKLNNAGQIFNTLTEMNNNLFSNYLGISCLRNKEENVQLANVIALMCPEPSSIMEAAGDADHRIKPCGSIQRGDGFFKFNTTGSNDSDSALNTFKSAGAPIYRSASKEGVQGLSAYYGAALTQYQIKGINPSSDLKTAWQTTYGEGGEDWMLVLLNVYSLFSGSAADYPYFGIILGGVHSIG